MSRRPLAGRVALVTGAGRGLGRAHALHLASLGAAVVVNDYDGNGADVASSSTAAAVAGEIRAAGGDALAAPGDCADFPTAERMVATAVESLGGLHILVNNAGILRDRMVFNLEEGDWDDVIRVHLRGHVAPLRAASRHWRLRAKQGEEEGARVITTASESGLYGNPGQTNYSTAKAGILALTQAAARELGPYGVTVNAIAPRARTRMVEQTWGLAAETFGHYRPEQVSAVVAWLAGSSSADVTGQVFAVFGDRIQLLRGWEPVTDISQDGGFTAETIQARRRDLFAGRKSTLPPFPFDPRVAGA